MNSSFVVKSIVPEGKQIANLLFRFLSIIITSLALCTGLEPVSDWLEVSSLIHLDQQSIVWWRSIGLYLLRCETAVSVASAKALTGISLAPTHVGTLRHCLVQGAGIEPTSNGYQPFALPFMLTLHCLVVQMGFEPTFIRLMRALHYHVCDWTIVWYTEQASNLHKPD